MVFSDAHLTWLRESQTGIDEHGSLRERPCQPSVAADSLRRLLRGSPFGHAMGCVLGSVCPAGRKRGSHGRCANARRLHLLAPATSPLIPAMARIDPGRVDARLPLCAFSAAVLWVLIALAMAVGQHLNGPADQWALLHALLLGVVGNTLAGAALQFGCAALGARPAFSLAAWVAVLLAFNLALLTLLVGPVLGAPSLRPFAGAAVALSLACWALPIAAAISVASGPRLSRALLVLGLCGLVSAAVVGALRLAGVATPGGVALHAVLGLVVGLLPTIVGAARLILPTLLGWELTALCAGRWPCRRRPALATAWLSGLGAVVLAAGVLVIHGRQGLAPALAFVVAGGLMTVVPATLLQITAFLHWWRLRQSVPRGRQVPGMPWLQPEALLWAWVAARMPAGLVWPLALAQPADIRWRVLGLALEAIAGGLLLIAFLTPGWRARRFRLACLEHPFA